jgi:hypothetical protein
MNIRLARAFRLPALSLIALLGACAAGQSDRPVIASTRSAVELRDIQSRTYDTPDQNRVLRASIATLQDHGYAITRVSPEAGTVTAVKAGLLRMTASAYPRGESQTVVRANALVPVPKGDAQVDDPLFYRNLFFEPLSRTLALDAMAAPAREEEAPMPAVPPAESLTAHREAPTS